MPAKRFLALTDPLVGRWRVVGDMQPLAIGFNRERSPGGVPQQADHPAIGDHEGDGHPAPPSTSRPPSSARWRSTWCSTRTVVNGPGLGGPRGGQRDGQRLRSADGGRIQPLFIANPELRAVPETSIFRLARVPAATTRAQLVRGVGAG